MSSNAFAQLERDYNHDVAYRETVKHERKQVNCHCDSYSFPHRIYSGKCAGHESQPDEPQEFNPGYMSAEDRAYDDAGMKRSDFA